MKGLARIYIVTLVATLLCWCAPLLLVPGQVASAIGAEGDVVPFLLRLLGWALLALCVSYAFGLQAAWRGQRRHAPLWAGIVSNGGTCVLLGWIVVTGTHAPWNWPAQAMVFLSTAGAALVGMGLLWYALTLDRLIPTRAPGGATQPAAPEQAARTEDPSNPPGTGQS